MEGTSASSKQKLLVVLIELLLIFSDAKVCERGAENFLDVMANSFTLFDHPDAREFAYNFPNNKRALLTAIETLGLDFPMVSYNDVLFCMFF
jgi:hypothetical protein